MVTTASTLVWRAVFALAVGIVAVAWPGITIRAFVLLFAGYAVVTAAAEFLRALHSTGAGPRVGRFLLAALGVAAAVVALVWPGLTVLVLVLLVAGWAFVTGALDVVLAFVAGETLGERFLYALTGLVSIALAIVLVLQPAIGAVTLAEVFGLFSIVTAVSLLALVATLHGKRRQAVVAAHAHV